MSRLYVVSVGNDWIGRFRRTVSSPIGLPTNASENLQHDETVQQAGPLQQVF